MDFNDLGTLKWRIRQLPINDATNELASILERLMELIEHEWRTREVKT